MTLLFTTIDPEKLGWFSAITALVLFAVIAIFGGGLDNHGDEEDEGQYD